MKEIYATILLRKRGCAPYRSPAKIGQDWIVPKKKIPFDAGRGAREIARERIGVVPSGKVIVSKRKKPPKHKKPITEDSE